MLIAADQSLTIAHLSNVCVCVCRENVCLHFMPIYGMLFDYGTHY